MWGIPLQQHTDLAWDVGQLRSWDCRWLHKPVSLAILTKGAAIACGDVQASQGLPNLQAI